MSSARRGVLSYLIRPLCLILLLCGIFCIVWLRSNLFSLEYKISELENRKMQGLSEAKRLIADTAAFQSIQKVENRTALHAGLVFPDRARVIYVRGKRALPQQAVLDGKQTAPLELKDY